MRAVRQEPVLDLQQARTGRFATRRVRLFVPSSGWGGRRRREFLLLAAGAAVLFHVAVVSALVEAPGLIPAFLRTPPPREPPPPPEAELVMVKQDTPTVGGTPPPQKLPPPAPKAEPRAAPAGGGPPDRLHAPDGPPLPPPADKTAASPGPPETGHAAQPAPPPAPPASTVQVNLDLDGQPGWGLVDPRTIAASPDDRYVNKPASYPRAAAERGEEGTVTLVTLVAPDGHAESVQVERSSGYPALDSAARDAIARWHFRPAIRGGVPVESEMRQEYHFRLIR
jgi:periplasmic protein TonB